MIKTAISGADTPEAGELVRILAMHPEVELRMAQAEGLEGRPLNSFHHGLIGETSLAFSSHLDCTKCNMLFMCEKNPDPARFKTLRLSYPEMKVITLHPLSGENPDITGVVYGLPEINRKALVRGATAAVIPSPFASMALVALYPLALNLLLEGDIEIQLSAPADILADYPPEEAAEEIRRVLSEVQLSFQGKVRITPRVSGTRRSAMMEISTDCPVDGDHLMHLYGMYDDHNFAFAVSRTVGASEVAGTDKCIVSVGIPTDGKVRLGVAADCRLRGGAGEAVHVMNLLFGLQEKVGLALKAIDFNPIDLNSHSYHEGD